MSRLASGEYHYWLNGERQTIREPWQLLHTGSGSQLRGQRMVAEQVLLDIDAQYHGAKCVALQLNWKPGKPGCRSFRYQLQGDSLLWQQADEPARHRFQLPPDSLLFPLLRAATGPILRHLTLAPRSLVLPCLRDPDDSRQFLRPLLSARSAESAGTAPNGERHYRYFGGEYGKAGSDYWLTAQGLVQRYRWQTPQADWEAHLDSPWIDDGFTGFR